MQARPSESSKQFPLQEIEFRYYQSEQKYVFPRKEISLGTSNTQKSLAIDNTYNLHSQNVSNDCQASRLQIKDAQMNRHLILDVKGIKQYVQRQSLKKAEKIKIIVSRSPIVLRQKDKKPKNLEKQAKTVKLNITSTPGKKSRSKSLSRSGKKLHVVSAHKIRRINDFSVGASGGSPRKGLAVFSKQKFHGTPYRSINIF